MRHLRARCRSEESGSITECQEAEKQCIVILFIDQIGRRNTKHIHKVAIRGGGNSKLMVLLAQQGLLFHCSNRLSRTNHCLDWALMFAGNHIIIQRNELL